MRMEFSELSRNAYDALLTTGDSYVNAVEFLNSELKIRSFISALRKYYSDPDLKERLVKAFLDVSPDANPLSVARRVQNWINEKAAPRTREDVYIICFALHLSLEQTSTLLGFVSDYGIHYRNPKDLSYAYCLKKGKTYHEAIRFYASLPHTTEQPDPKTTPGTRTVWEQFCNTETEEEFLTQYNENLDHLGAFHLNAYSYFLRYYRTIAGACPGESRSTDVAGEKIKVLSMETIAEEYLSLGVPLGKKRKHLTALQKMIKDGWPSATTLCDILNQKENVSRKLLLLFYIVTENGIDGEYQELDEDYMTAAQRLDEHYWILNSILDECGMNELDPRNAYDWLVLYSLYTKPDEDMDERMRSVIALCFPDQSSLSFAK